MSSKKYDKFIKVKKAIVASASGGIMAGILIASAGNVYAETVDSPSFSYSSNVSGMHLMHKWNSPAKINSLAGHLGLDSEKIKAELKDGKTLKQILQENGIAPEQLGKAFTTNKKSQAKRLMKQNFVNNASWQ